MPEILVLGGASWNTMIYTDRLPSGPATVFGARKVQGVGSTGIGKALTVQALGAKARLHCVLGTDAEADHITAFAAARHLELLVDTDASAPTPQHLNLMDGTGGRVSYLLENGAPTPPVDTGRMAPLIAQADVIFLGITPSSLPLLKMVAQAKAHIHVDLHDWDGAAAYHAPFIACADTVQLAIENLNDPISTCQALLKGRAQEVVLTKGAQGAEVFTADTHHTLAAAPAQLRDANGAGDAFAVAYTLSRLDGASIRQAGRFAAAVAALVVECPQIVPADLPATDIAMRAAQISR